MTLSKRTKWSLGVGAFVVVAVVVMWVAGAWDAIFDGEAVTPKLRSVLLLTGDSLTEKGVEPDTKGWITRLQDEYRRAADVIPRGLGGYNTRWYLKYAIPTLEKEILSGVYTPTFVTVWFGANDAALPNGSSYEQHVPREQYKQNLVKIVNAFKAMAPKAGILLITPPHVDDAARLELSMDLKGDKHGVIDRTNAMAGKYAQACVETAETMNIPVLDLYTYFNNMSEWERDELLTDGLHLNLKGNKLMFEQLQNAMSANFSGVVDKLWSWQLPSYARWVEDDPYSPDDDDDDSSEVSNTTTITSAPETGNSTIDSSSSSSGNSTNITTVPLSF